MPAVGVNRIGHPRATDGRKGVAGKGAVPEVTQKRLSEQKLLAVYTRRLQQQIASRYCAQHTIARAHKTSANCGFT